MSYNRSSWQTHQEVLFSQGPRQVIVFPNCMLISDGMDILTLRTFAHISKPFVFASCVGEDNNTEAQLQIVLPAFPMHSHLGF